MPTIESRLSEDGTVTYRVKVRLKGQAPAHGSFKRLTDAKRWAVQTEAAIREGRFFPASEARRRTVADLVERYLRDTAPQRPKNLTNTTRLLNWWKGRIGAMTLADVTPALVATCRDELLAETTRRKKLRGTGTVVRYLAALSHAFTIALKDWNWVDDNPVRKISKPREPRGRQRFLSDLERDRLLSACRESTSRFLYVVVILAISTGMRRGEIMGMRWANIDIGRGLLVLHETKNGSSRAVHLTGHALDLLVELAKVRRIDTDLVFHGNVKGKSVDLTKPWETALRKAEITDFRFHDLRHTAASYLAMNGATTMEIAAVLGHKTLQMVQRYSHLSNSHTAAVVGAMNAKIFGGVENG